MRPSSGSGIAGDAHTIKVQEETSHRVRKQTHLHAYLQPPDFIAIGVNLHHGEITASRIHIAPIAEGIACQEHRSIDAYRCIVHDVSRRCTILSNMQRAHDFAGLNWTIP